MGYLFFVIKIFLLIYWFVNFYKEDLRMGMLIVEGVSLKCEFRSEGLLESGGLKRSVMREIKLSI